MYQTTVQDSRTIRFGSGKVEVGDSVETLVNLGAMNGISFKETWDNIRVSSDNVGEVDVGINNHKAAIAGNLVEINLDNLCLLRGGIDLVTNIPGTLVTGATQTVQSGSWAYNKFIKIANQNGNGAPITVTSVAGSVNSALVENTDYYVGQNNAGEYGIFVIDSATITTANQNLTITYNYTPNAAKKFTSGGKNKISPKVVRVTNVNAEGKKFQITIYKAANESGISLELQTDDSGQFATTPINLVGVLDASRTAGDQLFEIYDEQSA
jgi:hypothetical protein